MMTHVENSPIAEINREIDAELLSQDTVDGFNRLLNMWKTAPIFFLIGLILYAYERSKGSDLPASLFFEYEVILILGLFISTFLIWVFGLTCDQIFGNFDANPHISDIDPIWDRTDVILICQKMVYIGCMIPSYVSALLYMIFPILRQTDNTFLDVVPDGEEREEYVTEFRPGQW